MPTREDAPEDLEQNSDRVAGCEGVPIALCRTMALDKARLMPSADELALPVRSDNLWIELGPRAIPKGERADSDPAGVLVSGRVTTIVPDPSNPSTIYLGAAMGGVWKSVDAGTTWNPTCDNACTLAIGALAMDPSNSRILYAGTGEGNLDVCDDFVHGSTFGAGILKTRNGGVTWKHYAESIFTAVSFFRLAVNPNDTETVFAATSAGLFRSMNGGHSWTKLQAGGLPDVAATDVTIDPTGRVYAAFWDQTVFRSDDADHAANPTWTQLLTAFPADGNGRVCLAISPSSPQTIFAMRTGDSNLYSSTDGGDTWEIRAPLYDITDYCSGLSVHPTNPGLVYISGSNGLWKLEGNANQATWISASIHVDHHGMAFHPGDPSIIYAATDGGIYKSADAGQTWDDTINKNLSITQFTYIDQHPSSDAVIFGGTQDNGTNQFRNSPVFNHSDNGDGGAVAIDRVNPQNILHVRSLNDVQYSDCGGETWVRVQVNNAFPADYPPLTLSRAGSGLAAFGAENVYLGSQWHNNWLPNVPLALDALEKVTAIDYVRADLIYAGTSCGKVFRAEPRNDGTAMWSAARLDSAALPIRHIWDICALPDDSDTVVLVMSGFGTPHVWKGVAQSAGAAAWTDISGTGYASLPDIPVNALVIDPDASNTMYIGTDVGAFCTTDGGGEWAYFSEGLPAAAVISDLRLYAPLPSQRLLRAATYGRGIWERDVGRRDASPVNLFLRANVMSTGRLTPPPSGVLAAFADPLQGVALGDRVHWWQCADLKVDAPPFRPANRGDVDYVYFESYLTHRQPTPGQLNRIYLQIHNRGTDPATNVVAKTLYADTSAGLADLPNDFWATFPQDSTDTTVWKSVGAAQTVASVSSFKPEIVSWEWTVPSGALDRLCFLTIIDCVGDPIPVANRVFGVQQLVNLERHVGLRSWVAPV